MNNSLVVPNNPVVVTPNPVEAVASVDDGVPMNLLFIKNL